jgi:hypothetical protein
MQQLHEFYDELHLPPPSKEDEHPKEESPEEETSKVEEIPKKERKRDIALTVEAKEWMLESVEKKGAQTTLHFACKNCRSVLFNDLDLRAHVQGKGSRDFRPAKRE